MYEHQTHPLLSRAKFARRVARRLLLALFLVGIALGIGVLGYHLIGGLSWIDSLLNASMILGGMGPVDPLRSSAAKIFAGFRRHRRTDDRPVCPPSFAPFSHRRKMRDPATVGKFRR